ncbi:hypothetical protein H2201_002263 [Coniosporium apollinis]|uniref:Uncharacterized protein n=2 Tax=Coniosporium TaxID=2810619 RepID=A0ABQ9P124_9PEZI|nr:hypothetical protein H2199_005696 [Cladosporium sp. JES 115]KAJ9667728.1 hypothetical protein H2201_002263 [Coniosporium apollinis]
MLDAPSSSATVPASSSVDTPEASPATNPFGGCVLIIWQDIPQDLKDDEEVHTSKQFKKVCENSYLEFISRASDAFRLRQRNLSILRLEYNDEKISTFTQLLEYAASILDCVEIKIITEVDTPKSFLLDYGNGEPIPVSELVYMALENNH